jgi:hypothetical protein
MSRLVAAALLAGTMAVGSAAAQPDGHKPPPAAQERAKSLLLADTTRQPHIVVSWPTRDGKVATLAGDRGYKSQGDKTPLGKNIQMYVALGGTRLERGKANPEGAVVRVGLYKEDASKLFFENIAENAAITITISNVKMSGPAEAQAKSGLIHLRYMLSDLASCGIDSSGRNLLLTADPQDPLKESYGPESTRLGALDGVDTPGERHGSITETVNTDGTSTVTFRIPYTLLRHIKDPYQRTTPGGFFEPQHFHVEIEFLPTKGGDPEPAPRGPAGEVPASDR